MSNDDMPKFVQRIYDADEYWDLSGLPFEVEQKRPLSSDLDPNVDDPALD